MRTADSPSVLACIYTCEAHRPLLERFYDSAPGRVLRESARTRVIEVYADPTVKVSCLRGDRLDLRAEERYDALSVKTHRMIEFCTENLAFSTLLKIDVTTVMSRMDGPEYAGRLPIDQEGLAHFLREVDFGHDYAGFMCHESADRSGAEGWAAKKGVVIDYSRLFGDGPMPRFFSGKCYLLSRRFAAYVARHGAEMADEHREYFPGAEDVMIGRLFQRFQAENGR